MPAPKRTPLFDWHVEHGGRMVDFAGWEMPVQYSSIVAEHSAVRTNAGLFDVSHMGRLFLDGPEAANAVADVVTCNVLTMKVGRVRYGLVLNQDGCAIDDVLVTRLAEESWLVVANASGRDHVAPLLNNAASKRNVAFADRTEQLTMLALQGPSSEEIITKLFPGTCDPSQIGYYWATSAAIFGPSVGEAGPDAIISRTGYTGEDGFELIVPAKNAIDVANRLVEAGVAPCGLGARDTLRLEAGMPLYGHELSLEIDPKTAGLQFACRKSGGFAGAEALARLTPSRARVGLVFDGKRPVREGASLFIGDAAVGRVTSGTMSPTLAKPIAMGFVDVAHSEPGQAIDAEVRGTRIPGTVVDLPFYKRS